MDMIEEMINKKYREAEAAKGGFVITDVIVPPEEFTKFRIKKIISSLFVLVICAALVIVWLLNVVFSIVITEGDIIDHLFPLIISLAAPLLLCLLFGPCVIGMAKDLMVLFSVKNEYVFIDRVCSYETKKFVQARGGGVGTFIVKTHHLAEICSYLNQMGFYIIDEELPPITTDSGMNCLVEIYIIPYKNGLVGIKKPNKINITLS